MISKTEAIVINRVKYNDNSYIVNFYSLEFGRFAAIVRIPKSKKAEIKPSTLFPLNILEIEVKIKETRTIQSLNFCNSAVSLKNINTDIYKICISQFIAEILSKSIREEEKNKKMYAFIRDIILGLENSIENINDIHLVFLKDFAKELGFGITNNHCEEMPYFNLSEGMFMPFYTSENESLDIENSTILSNLLDSKHSCLKINFKIRKILLQKLLEYYKLHVSGFGEIKSLKVFNEVFS